MSREMLDRLSWWWFAAVMFCMTGLASVQALRGDIGGAIFIVGLMLFCGMFWFYAERKRKEEERDHE